MIRDIIIACILATAISILLMLMVVADLLHEVNANYSKCSVVIKQLELE